LPGLIVIFGTLSGPQAKKTQAKYQNDGHSCTHQGGSCTENQFNQLFLNIGIAMSLSYPRKISPHFLSQETLVSSRAASATWAETLEPMVCSEPWIQHQLPWMPPRYSRLLGFQALQTLRGSLLRGLTQEWVIMVILSLTNWKIIRPQEIFNSACPRKA